MSSNSQRADAHPSLFVAPGDDVKMRFYRAALLAPWPGKAWPGVIIALWLIENMDWASGEVKRHTSVRHLVELTDLSRDGVDSGLAALVAAKLIERTYLGKGKRGAIRVHQVVMAMPNGTLVTDLWKVACLTGHSGLPHRPLIAHAEWPAARAASGLPRGPEWPAGQADNPIPSYPEAIPASRSSSKVDMDPTTEGPLPTSIIRLPGSLKKEEPPLPPVASATVVARVAPTPINSVAPAPNGEVWTHEIAGFNGETSSWVKRLAMVADPCTLNFDPAHTAIRGSIERVDPMSLKAAIIQMEAKRRKGELTSSNPLRAVIAWAKNITPADAAKIVAADGKPAALNPINLWGIRR